MMKIITKAPATCGEYIQGIWRNQPCLVSAPIDMFSTTVIEPGNGNINLEPKAMRLLKEFCRTYYINESFLNDVNIQIFSKIPRSIGFGSSTADCTSLIKALANYFYVEMSEEELAKFIIRVDPTDNIMFKKLNLFNHYTGDVLFNFNHSITAELLVLANLKQEVNTIEFGYLREFKRSESTFKRILDKFTQGCVQNDIRIIGEATTESAVLNESCLSKPRLSGIIALVEKHHGYGIIIGHSGSVIGIIKDKHFNDQKFLADLSVLKEYREIEVFKQQLIEGGIKIEYQFE